MWERSSRFNPISTRYRLYLDHRPILPQDPTVGFLRPAHDENLRIFFYFIFNGTKGLFINNLPAKERQELKKFYQFYGWWSKNIERLCYVPGIFIAGFLFNLLKGSRILKYKIMYPVVFLFSIGLARAYIKGLYDQHFDENMSYYYHKYSHLAFSDIKEVEDPRRKYFQLDTTSYYRETANDILHGHGGGHGGHGGHGHHDSSTYYGPHPYDDHENLQTIKEIDRKFNEGKSIYDEHPESETILGNTVNIRRFVKPFPTVESYRAI